MMVQGKRSCHPPAKWYGSHNDVPNQRFGRNNRLCIDYSRFLHTYWLKEMIIENGNKTFVKNLGDLFQK